MNYKSLLFLSPLIAMLACCSLNNSSQNSDSSFSNVDVTSNSIFSSESSSEKISSTSSFDSSIFTSSSEITGDFKIDTKVSNGFNRENNINTITKGGTFTLSGSLLNGQIIINAPNEEVELELKNFKITNSNNSPIYALEAEQLKIKSIKDTYNEISENRNLKLEANDALGSAAIYAKCDLHFVGKGTLVVNASYNNGIHTTKDLKIKNSSIKVTAPNNAFKGNNSITIESGNILAISTGGDAFKTEKTDLSSKGKQRGNITITGGNIDTYSACDAFDASYNFEISNGVDEDGKVTTPVINAFTNNYSSYTGQIITANKSCWYIRTSNRYSNSTYRYAIYLNNKDNTNTWVDANYYKSSGSYYFYALEKPVDFSSFYVYMFQKNNQPTNSTTNYYAVTGLLNDNETKDTIVLDSISRSTISYTKWTNYSDTGTTDYSSKGIKADNSIIINGGIINIKSDDDGIHCDKDNIAFDNGNAPLGVIDIQNGEINIISNDDGIHADSTLNISGGTINISETYEGIEATVINISGGSTTIVAKDDGVNAGNCISGLTPLVNVTGGYLDVTVGTGDTDGIDSNGSYTQSGGIVVTRGPGNSSSRSGGPGGPGGGRPGGGGGGGMIPASSLDIGEENGGTASISGGTLISFGQMAANPTLSNGVVSYTGLNSTSYSANSYCLKFGEKEIIVKNIYNYSGLYFFSNEASKISVTLQ